MPRPDLTELKSGLMSGVSWEREKPFRIRTFDAHYGDEWVGDAVAYGCYRAGQAPGKMGPTDEELLEDLRIIAENWKLIRLYGADDDTRRIIRLIDEQALPVRVLLGLWLEPDDKSPNSKKANIDQLLLGVELASMYPHIVNSISVGNETQVFWSGHRMPYEDVVRYIRAVRSHVTVPVTTADDYMYWRSAESKTLGEECDFVLSHFHPLLNGQSLEDGIKWIDKIYRAVGEVHPERQIVIGETGWATDYDANLTGEGEQGTLIKGDVSVDAQADFLIDLQHWIDSSQVPTFLFEVFDESWKGGGDDSSPRHVEKHWGVFNEDRSPKESFVRFLKYVGAQADE